MTTRRDIYVGPYLGTPLPSPGDVHVSGASAAVTAQPLLGANTVHGSYIVLLTCAVSASAGSAGTITLSCNCTGENGATPNTYSLPPCNAQVQDLQTGIFNVSADGSGDITYQVDFAGIVTVGALSYSYRVTAIQATNIS